MSTAEHSVRVLWAIELVESLARDLLRGKR
jgi:hypothetical protein